MKHVPVWAQNKDTKEKYIKCYAIVDDEDFETINALRWNLNHKGYAYKRKNKAGDLILMHRLITNCPSGMVVDHINHDTLDNRRANLRNCTCGDNVKNQRGRKGSSSKYKGVVYVHGNSTHRKKWQATINCDGKKETIGWFHTEDAAALARNKRELELFKEFSCLNILPYSEEEITRREKELETKTSKYVGVNFNKASQKWMARLQYNFKNYYLGLYNTEDEAWQALCKKKNEVIA